MNWHGMAWYDIALEGKPCLSVAHYTTSYIIYIYKSNLGCHASQGPWCSS